MRLVSIAGAACAAAVLALPATANARPLVHEHYSDVYPETFVETGCGEPMTIDYVGTFTGLFKLKAGRGGDPTPYLSDNYSSVETFTNVENGKTFTFAHEGMWKDVRIELVTGTTYLFTAIEVGRPFVVYGPDGERLIWDRGQIRVQFLVDTQGDADLSNDVWLSDVGVSLAGPHPILLGEVDFCDAVELIR
jgi:hypothetical protein